MVVHYNTGHLGVVVDDNVYGPIVVVEIILPWSWLIGIVAFLVLVGYLLQGRRESYCLKSSPLPDHLELFRQRQRRRQQHPTLKRLSRLN